MGIGQARCVAPTKYELADRQGARPHRAHDPANDRRRGGR